MLAVLFEPLAAASDAACDLADRAATAATALWSGVQALNQQHELSYDRAAATFGGTRTATLVARDGTTCRSNFEWPCAAAAGRYRPSRRPRSDRRTVVPAIGDRAGHAACRGRGTPPAIGKADLESFVVPQGQTLVAPETLCKLGLSDLARRRRWRAAAAARAAAIGAPAYWSVDIGIAQRRLNMRAGSSGC